MHIRNAILSLSTQPRQREPITFAGQQVFIVEMTAQERDAFEAAQVTANAAGKGLDNFRAKLIVRTVVDEAGQRVFTDADVDAVGQLPARIIRKAFDIAQKLNAVSDDDVKEFEKNS